MVEALLSDYQSKKFNLFKLTKALIKPRFFSKNFKHKPKPQIEKNTCILLPNLQSLKLK